MDEVSARPESAGEPYTEWTARLFDPSRRHLKPEALRGIRVLDLSVIIFGPATADFLGELGAEVIKVEMPGQGDVTRILGHAGCFWKNVSVAFFPKNHGKYHVGVDMHHAEGQALIRKLVARADVLVENFKPGTTEAKWGLGYRQLREINPGLIYVANTGFGQWGPFAEGRASYDGLAQAVSGLSAISGFEGALPIKSGRLPRRLVRRLPLGHGRAGRPPLARPHGRGPVRRDGPVRGARPRARLDVALRRPDGAQPAEDGTTAAARCASGSGGWTSRCRCTPSSR